ncbi:TetR/AcrR family transcriptional regulator [Nocardia sp. NBC_00511]|uniref:TetR/AcrR family transcriptional regulator n=1 Tax=Nocardia sp. NBC_00511 TaxID=2903591 RepID=UPI0030E4BF83
MAIEHRREHVLDAALRLVLRDGYTAATMEAIAREANLAKPRVYAAYPGRGPLLLALLEREQQRAVAALDIAMPEFTADTDVATTLEAAATSLLHAVATNPGPWRLLNLNADEAPPEVHAHIADTHEFALSNLRALLAWGREHQPGIDDYDVELLAVSLLAVGEQLIRLTLADPDRYPTDRLTDFIRTTLGAFDPARTTPSDS